MSRPSFSRSAVVRGGAMVAVGGIVGDGLGTVLNVLLGVELGADGYGVYAFVIATAAFLGAVARFGLSLGSGCRSVRAVARFGLSLGSGCRSVRAVARFGLSLGSGCRSVRAVARFGLSLGSGSHRSSFATLPDPSIRQGPASAPGSLS